MKQLIINSTSSLTIFKEDGSTVPILNAPEDVQLLLQQLYTYADAIKTPEEEAKEVLYDFVKTKATDEEKLEMVLAFPTWQINKSYAVGDELQCEGKLYRVIQAHVSQMNWGPETTPALFVEVAPPGVIPDWVQPTGAHDAYNIGDKVMFEGQVYESLINANTWSPTAYPAGWQLVV